MTDDRHQYRYPGTRPFETSERNLFYGRNDDSEQLFRQVLNEKTILLYAKSGLGKSSLINAGLLPLLETLPGYDILQVRFGNFNTQNEEYEKPLEKLAAQIPVVTGPRNHFLDNIIPNENSLWYRLKKWQKAGEDKTLLFIFDQFEELLTYPAEDIFFFKKQFANALFADIPANIRAVLDRKLEKNKNLLSTAELQLLTTPLRVKCLFAIRNDRMSDLNQVADYFPNILKTFYELKPLNKKQAELAITEPAAMRSGNYSSVPFSFSQDVVDNIIRTLQDDFTQSIESFQLQMVCRYAENLIVAEKTNQPAIISLKDLGNIPAIFAENYFRILDELPSEYRAATQVMIEEKLIVGGNRVPLPEIVILQQHGIPQQVIDSLLNSHILRAELNSTGRRSIELSHDTLIVPVTEAFEKRKVAMMAEKFRLEKEWREVEAAFQEAKLKAARKQADLERVRADLQENLRKDAERAQQRTKVVSRYMIFAMGVSLIVSITAYSNYIKAKKATESANIERNKADSAYNELKKGQMLSKAIELKGYGDSYKDLGQGESARKTTRRLSTVSVLTRIFRYIRNCRKNLKRRINEIPICSPRFDHKPGSLFAKF